MSSEPTRGELLARVFEFGLPDLLSMLADKTAKEEPAARTMALVALANVRQLLKANESLNKSDRAGLPTTYADFGRTTALLFDEYPPTGQSELDIPGAAEIRFRRLYHFYHAAILGTVSERAHATNAHLEALANIWYSYINSAKHLQKLLENTIIWSSDEIEWFRGCTDEESYIRYVMYTLVPDVLWQHDEMLSMAKKEFDVWPSLLKRYS